MTEEVMLLDRPEDYKRLGINPYEIEQWEDGVRDSEAPDHFEWWYFDCILDNGMKVVIQFLSKNGRTISSSEFHPTIFFKVTMPDGEQKNKEYHISAKDILWSKESCDVHFGPHFFQGDLKVYHIHMELQDGMAAELTMESISKPYRPGTSYFQFGNPRDYYTWLCAVPRGKVDGSLTMDGKTVNVNGTGYHDHQWGSINFHKYWNHWIWARQSFEDYSMLLFDFFTNEEFGWKRFTIFFIQDGNGNIVFENKGDAKCLVEKRYSDDASGKEYPSRMTYEFENKKAQVTYQLEETETIEKKGMNTMPIAMRLMMKVMRIQASYARYVAKGNLKVRSDALDLDRCGTLIYEIMCPGKQCVPLMDTRKGGH
jgi:hypothetical protein